MKTVSISETENRLTERAREVEAGETIVVTRNGRQVLDLVPHRERGGLNFAAGEPTYGRASKSQCHSPPEISTLDNRRIFLLRPLPEK
jgi:antitoxin (DNA-binding transcriptional repressor) of toxin-antitoxin stability system